MKKLITNLKVFMTLLLLCGVCNAWGESKATYIFGGSSKSGWTVSVEGAPSGASATYNQTYGTLAQITSSNSETLTISGYAGYKIKSITLSMKSNSKGGSGYYSLTAGKTVLSSIGDADNTKAFNSASWNGSWSTSYVNVTPDMLNDNYIIKENEDVVFYIYASANSLYCESVTITYEESTTPAKELVSIAVSGNPSKTTYEIGEAFAPAGLTVTGTYDDASTADLTDDAEWTFDLATFTSTSQTSVSVTATVSGKSDTKEYAVTVSQHIITPGTYDINLNNALWGTKYNGTFSLSANSLDLNGTSNDVALNLKNGTSTNGYITDDQTRAYNGYSLKFTAPTGYELQSIVFTQVSGKDWKGTLSADKGKMENDNKTWSGNSNDVTISFSGTCVIEKVTVTYAAPKVVSNIAVKNAPSKTTYYVGEEFNPEGLVITASYDSGDPEDIAYSEDNKDAFSFSGFNSEAEATDQVITVTYAEKSAAFTIDIETERTLNSITVASNPSKMVYEVGEALDLTGLVVNGIFSKGAPEPVEYTADPEDGTTLDVAGTTTITLTSVDNQALTTSFNVTVNAIEGDRLTLSETGVTGSSYAAWGSSYTAPSGAVYTGRNAGGNSAIQLRSDATTDKPASGIISTTSGGNIAKVIVVWESHTAADRELEVFGSNTAYTAVADLVDNTKKGTSLGTIKNGTSTELIIDGKYAYVGVRSKSGAMYLTSITFVWKEKETYTRTVNKANIGTLCVPYAFEKPETMTLYNIVGKDESKIYFEENTEDIVAGKPYLFRSTEETITLTYAGEKATEAGSSNGLVGTFEGCVVTKDAGNYILSNNTLYVVNNEFTCGANRAYIHIEGIEGGAPASAAKAFTLDFDEPTGISTIGNGQSTFDNSKAYNLNGVRVNEAYKGIVIMNGKKYINK